MLLYSLAFIVGGRVPYSVWESNDYCIMLLLYWNPYINFCSSLFDTPYAEVSTYFVSYKFHFCLLKYIY
jgi:hypothetical protein